MMLIPKEEQAQPENPRGIFTPDLESLEQLMHYTDFAQAARSFNQQILEELRTRISRTNPPNSGIAYVTQGSHAREENSFSPIELTLIHEDDFDISDYRLEETRSSIEQEFPGMLYPYNITINAKLHDENKMPNIVSSKGRGPKVDPFPSMLEAVSLYDPSEVLERTRGSLIDKLRTPIGRVSRRKQNGLFNKARETTMTGQGSYKKQRVPHVDYEAGVSFFSKNDEGIRQESFKQGPLRLVQFRLSRDFVAYARDNEGIEMRISDMPANVSDRLFYIRDSGMASPSLDAESISDHYQYFLHQQYISAENYHNKGLIETEFDRAEVGKRAQDLIRLTEKPLF